MKFIDNTPASTPSATASSTAAFEQRLLAGASQADAQLARDLFDERDQLKAAEAQRQAAVRASTHHARACRSAGIEELTLIALKNATCKARVLAKHRRYRAGELLKYLVEHFDRYVDDLKQLPSRDSIRAVLDRHGWLDRTF